MILKLPTGRKIHGWLLWLGIFAHGTLNVGGWLYYSVVLYVGGLAEEGTWESWLVPEYSVLLL